jgi:hypothetical protein
MVVSYEEMVSKPEKVFLEISEFLSVSNNFNLDNIHTSSVGKGRRQLSDKVILEIKQEAEGIG